MLELQDLPPELLATIIEWIVHQSEMLTVMSVCKEWQLLGSLSPVWNDLVLEESVDLKQKAVIWNEHSRTNRVLWDLSSDMRETKRCLSALPMVQERIREMTFLVLTAKYSVCKDRLLRTELWKPPVALLKSVMTVQRPSFPALSRLNLSLEIAPDTRIPHMATRALFENVTTLKSLSLKYSVGQDWTIEGRHDLECSVSFINVRAGKETFPVTLKSKDEEDLLSTLFFRRNPELRLLELTCFGCFGWGFLKDIHHGTTKATLTDFSIRLICDWEDCMGWIDSFLNTLFALRPHNLGPLETLKVDISSHVRGDFLDWESQLDNFVGHFQETLKRVELVGSMWYGRNPLSRHLHFVSVKIVC